MRLSLGTGIKYPPGSQNQNKSLRSHTTVKHKSAIYPFPGKQTALNEYRHGKRMTTVKDVEVGRAARMPQHVLSL